MLPTTLTRQPRNFAETGLAEPLLKELLLKHLYDGGILDLVQLCNRLKLAGTILDAFLQDLRKNQRVQALSPNESNAGVRYQLTELGRADAGSALLKSGYLGPVPVTLAHYEQLISAQSFFTNKLTREQILSAFKGVVVNPQHLDILGPALHSGKPILVYGQAGTGKTYVCKKVASILGGGVYIPYAIAVGMEIIQYFDPLVHIPVESAKGNANLEFDAAVDQRLIYCHRPASISGGELTMDLLDLKFDASTRVHSAPIQMKANNGIYIIDDLGRQRMNPIELFNRWIVPMEERRDFLALNTGKHFSVPFDCVLIFSTNLKPTELADEAFLRRLGYKINFTPISRQQFTQIWQDLLDVRQVTAEADVLDYLFGLFKKTGYALLPCHPRDLMDIALDIGAYLNYPDVINTKNIQLAWETYFVQIKES